MSENYTVNKLGLMMPGNSQQSDFTIIMSNFTAFLLNQITQPNVMDLNPKWHKDIILFYQDIIKRYIELFRKVEMWPDDMNEKVGFIFDRDVTVYEMYKVIYHLDKLTIYYLDLYYGKDSVPAEKNPMVSEKRKREIRQDREYREYLYNTPEAFFYH